MTNRQSILACFGIMQIAAFVAAIIVLANHIGRTNPWPIIVVFGLILSQCALAAGFAVFAPWRVFSRMISSALLVIVGTATLMLSDVPRLRFADFFLFALFALLMWLLNQAPLWLCRLCLRARTVINDSADNQLMSRSQYGIRQLMGLTLAVSLILGFGRMILPAQVLENLKDMKIVDWIVFVTIDIAAGLIVSTTIVASLNPRYLHAGVIVSALSSGLIAYGIYSILNMLNAGPPPPDRIFFAIMLLFTYAWLQISIFVIRAAGYRIVVGA